ncbi:RNA-binding domain-containing protein [Aaosphaeria arxii CBS 175.79]|uniref:RNA-binding domain-containing protein n=1 Tax=Aaosphaeria arxii CBS 175.79 TaxID=1450172 RepID=A0A6A5XRS8_9PLEO|nr:RNA-binding domain-containing protein [Aaosphaeria arxii CBS 175.79]KAF2015451.1 RNA-binding domain-containing protein [Aaosphaeria arxii CBS 175.79]
MSAPVDSVTAQMATTSLTDNNAATTDNASTQPTAAENEAVLASAAEGRRLYIGNLAYATTEGELKDFFKDYLVESTTIPTNPRTSRPVGYAFVALSTPTEAERAIAELNGKAILDRKVSIQLARTPEAHAEGSGSGAEGTSGTEHRRRASTRGRGRGRGRGARAGRGGRKADGAEGAETTEGEAAATDSTPAAVLPLTDATNDASAEKGAEKKNLPPRERKQRGPPEDGVPSKTKVMVANLPYDLKEDKLLEIFKDYQPTTAKIALRPIPRFMVKKLQARNEPRKGRGFGFVTLGSEELQQKACAEMNGKEIEGREIAVKVAIDSPGKEDDHPEAATEGEEAAAAPAATEAPAATTTETPAATTTA